MPETSNETPDSILIEPRLDDDGRLMDDLHCRRCGYALRGLKPDGQCPECQTAVRQALRSDLLQYCDPVWVTALARGGEWIAFSIMLIFAAPPIVHVIGKVWPWFGVLYMPATTIPRIVQAIGFWLATTPDPSHMDREAPWSARRIARWSAVILALLTVTSRVLEGGGPRSSVMTLVPLSAFNSLTAQAAAHLTFGAVAAIAVAALLEHARTIAKRIPDESLARRCRQMSIILGVLLMLRGGAGAFDALFIANVPRGAPSDFEMPFNLAAMAAMIPALFLVFKMRDRLKDAALRARESWASS